MEVTAITRNVRMSAQKGRPLARKCQGLPVSAALQIVEFSPRKAAAVLSKTLKSVSTCSRSACACLMRGRACAGSGRVPAEARARLPRG